MKTNIWDYIGCALSFTFLIGLAAVYTVSFVAPFTSKWLGNFGAIIDFFTFLFLCGIFGGLFIRICLRLMPLKSGTFPMEDKNISYFKFLMMNYELGDAVIKPFNFVPFRPLVLKLFGAKMGKDIAIGGHIDCPFMTEVGDNAIIGNGTEVASDVLVDGKLIIGKIKIGKSATIGMNVVIMPDVEIGDGAIVEIGSVVLPGSRIPAGERWRGNPARKWIG